VIFVFKTVVFVLLQDGKYAREQELVGMAKYITPIALPVVVTLTRLVIILLLVPGLHQTVIAALVSLLVMLVVQPAAVLLR